MKTHRLSYRPHPAGAVVALLAAALAAAPRPAPAEDAPKSYSLEEVFGKYGVPKTNETKTAARKLAEEKAALEKKALRKQELRKQALRKQDLRKQALQKQDLEKSSLGKTDTSKGSVTKSASSAKTDTDYWRGVLFDDGKSGTATQSPAKIRRTPPKQAPPPPFFQGNRPTSVDEPIRYTGGMTRPTTPPAPAPPPPPAPAAARRTPAQVAPPQPFFQGSRPTSADQPIRYTGGLKGPADTGPGPIEATRTEPGAAIGPAGSASFSAKSAGKDDVQGLGVHLPGGAVTGLKAGYNAAPGAAAGANASAGSPAGGSATRTEPGVPRSRTYTAADDPNFKAALKEARSRVQHFREAAASGNEAAMKEAAIKVRESTIAPQLMNQMEGPEGAELRGKFNQVYEGQIINPAKNQTVIDLSTEGNAASAKTFTAGPNKPDGSTGAPKIENKVGADNDITLEQTKAGTQGKVKGDLPYKQVEPTMERNLFESAHGREPASQAEATEFRKAQRVEITDGKTHLESYPEGFFNPEKPIDGGHLTEAAKYKNMEPFHEGQRLLGQAAEGGEGAAAANMKGQEQLYEAFRTMSKQGKKLEGIVTESGGAYPEHVQQGLEIAESVAKMKISPEQGLKELQGMGSDFKTMSEKVSGQAEAAMNLRKPKGSAETGAGEGAGGGSWAGTAMRVGGEVMMVVDGKHRIESSLFVLNEQGEIIREKTPEEKARSAVENMGGFSAGMGGALALGAQGAAAGSVLGPVGSVVGGLTGGMAGYFAGNAVGTAAAGAAYSTVDPENMTPEERQTYKQAEKMYIGLQRNGVPPELAAIVTEKFLGGDQKEWKQYMTEIRRQFGPGVVAAAKPKPGDGGGDGSGSGDPGTSKNPNGGEAKLGGLPPGTGSSTNTVLGQHVDNKQQNSSDNANSANEGGKAQQQVTQGSNAGDGKIAQAGNLVNNAGAQAQATGLASARTTAGAQVTGSWVNVVGSGIVTGVSTGIAQGVAVLGAGAGGRLVANLTGGQGHGPTEPGATDDPNVTMTPEGYRMWVCPKCGDGYSLHPGESAPAVCPFCGKSVGGGGTQVASANPPGASPVDDPRGNEPVDDPHGGAHGSDPHVTGAAPGASAQPGTRTWTCPQCGGTVTLGANEPDPVECPFGAWRAAGSPIGSAGDPPASTAPPPNLGSLVDRVSTPGD